jgi:hypothetical protein
LSCLIVTSVGAAAPVCTSIFASPPAPKVEMPAMPQTVHLFFASFRKTGDPGSIELKPITCAMLRGGWRVPEIRPT